MERIRELCILGNLLRTQRLKAGLTQVELAERASIDRNYIGMIERGERNPTYLSLLKIVKALNITIGELLIQ